MQKEPNFCSCYGYDYTDVAIETKLSSNLSTKLSIKYLLTKLHLHATCSLQLTTFTCQLACKCRHVKNASKIYSIWLWNDAVNVKLSERSNPVKIFHIIDIEKLLGIDNLDVSF